MGFDLDRFVSLSKAVDLSDIDWAEAGRVGITDDEAQVLRYMQDTESHTVLYLRDLLTGYTAQDPEVTTFLACWVYEETHHGRALDRFLVQVGRPAARERYAAVHVRPSFREMLTGLPARLAANATPHFAAVHMAWGAVNEFLAAMSYTLLARRSKNPPLQKLLLRLAKDERRHFAFYHDQAERRLRSGGRLAQVLCAQIMGRVWEPVGIGVGGAHTADMFASYLFSDQRGSREVATFDEMVRALPGMAFWTRGQEWIANGCARFKATNPTDFARHRVADAARDAETEAHSSAA